jgi:hypothetical protein
MVWKISFQTIAVLTAIVIANLDYLWHDKRTRKFKRTRIFLYVLAALTLVLSIVVTIKDDRQHQHEIGQLTTALHTLQNETSTLRAEAKQSASQQQSQMVELIEGNKRLQSSLNPFQTLAKTRYPGLEDSEALERFRSDIAAVEKRASDLEKKVQAFDPVLQPIRAATATVELQVESEEQINTTYMDRGGYFALARGSTPLLMAAGREANARQIGNSRVQWRAVWSMDASDQAIGKRVKYLSEAEYCQISFLMMAKDSKVLKGSVRLIINSDIQLDFVIPQQKVAEDIIIIRDISKILSKLHEKTSEHLAAPE